MSIYKKCLRKTILNFDLTAVKQGYRQEITGLMYSMYWISVFYMYVMNVLGKPVVVIKKVLGS